MITADFREMTCIYDCKVGMWQRRFRRQLLKVVFALPVAAVLLAGAHQAGESKALERLPEEGSGDASAGAAQSDSLTLVNRTDTAFVYLAFHPKTARPQPAQVEVDLGDPGPAYVAAGDSAYVTAGDSRGLWACDSLEQYENYTLHLYRIPAGAQGVVQAPLARSVVLTTERLNAARHRCCRLEIGDL